MDNCYCELEYNEDPTVYACALASLPGFSFLDSRKRHEDIGRFDIICALPWERFTLTDDDATQWVDRIEQGLSKYGAGAIAIGHLDYDSAAVTLGVSGSSFQPASAGIYRWHVLQDHYLKRCWLVSDSEMTGHELEQIRRRLLSPPTMPRDNFRLLAPFTAESSRRQYMAAIERIKDYIGRGDCYQVNFAQRFVSRFQGDCFYAFLQLRNVAPGDFSAFLRPSPAHSILSMSPERFLTISNGEVTTQPIKGTRPRHSDPQEDQRIAEELKLSIKDRAENVMITDLLRNDLGRYCEPGSVLTTELCALHHYDNVHHLVSTVTGRLKQDTSPGDILLGCSPGGSITGAPKKRAAEIIRELESEPRGSYCGSVFAIWPDGRLQSSIAIRTVEAVDDRLYCWGGGGIVYDSEPDAEYQETLDKVGPFMRTLEQLGQ